MTALIQELAYVVLQTADLSVWERFASEILGFDVVRQGPSIFLRMDARPFRYLVHERAGEGPPVLGWQVADAGTLTLIAGRLADQGISAASLGNGQLVERQAKGGLSFTCHNGIAHELAYGLADAAAFNPSGDVTGFVTSPNGLGHVVWSIPDVAAMDRLMLDAFDATLREDILTPVGPGHFFGCNARHHTLAAFSAPALRIEHLLVEMKDLDDVGRAMDRAIETGRAIAQPLGRHRTDQMVSFYVRGPSGFDIEVGCYGVLCGEDWREVRDGCRRRPWGHGDAMRKHQRNFPESLIEGGA